MMTHSEIEEQTEMHDAGMSFSSRSEGAAEGAAEGKERLSPEGTTCFKPRSVCFDLRLALL